MSTDDEQSKVTPAVARRVAGAAAVGNFMEWFDFAVYGFFAVTIGKVFFPSDSETASLLSSLAVYGVAFLVRPIGGLVLGAFADRHGRRAALSLTVVLMGVSTTLVAVLPTYASVGFLAPVLLILLRCAQGFSAGGEWTGTSAFLVEYAPRNRRALWGSVVSMTAAFGTLGGAAVALALSTWLTEAQMTSWGWRIPFLLAAPLGAIGLYVRLRLEDTPVFRELQAENAVSKRPLQESGRRNLRAIGLVMASASISGLGYYYLGSYVITYLTETVGVERSTALATVLGGIACYALLCPCAGLLSDRIGRRPSVVTGCFGLAVVSLPMMLLLATGAPAPAIARHGGVRRLPGDGERQRRRDPRRAVPGGDPRELERHRLQPRPRDHRRAGPAHRGGAGIVDGRRRDARPLRRRGRPGRRDRPDPRPPGDPRAHAPRREAAVPPRRLADRHGGAGHRVGEGPLGQRVPVGAQGAVPGYAPGRASSSGSGSIGEPPSYQPGAVQYSKCR